MGIHKSDALESHFEHSPLLVLPPAANVASVANGEVASHHLASYVTRLLKHPPLRHFDGWSPPSIR